MISAFDNSASIFYYFLLMLSFVQAISAIIIKTGKFSPFPSSVILLAAPTADSACRGIAFRAYLACRVFLSPFLFVQTLLVGNPPLQIWN